MRRLALILAGSALAVAVAGCGGAKTERPLPETVIGTIATTPTAKGNATAGKQVFVSQGCGSCHTFTPAGTNGTVGPNLTETLKGKPADFVRTSIVDPNAVIASGYAPSIMPQTYGSQLSAKQLADLVAFLTQQ